LFKHLQSIGQSKVLPFAWSFVAVIFGATFGPLPVVAYLCTKKDYDGCGAIANDEERLLLCDDEQIETESLSSVTPASLD
jgi:hypothetical protein